MFPNTSEILPLVPSLLGTCLVKRQTRGVDREVDAAGLEARATWAAGIFSQPLRVAARKPETPEDNWDFAEKAIVLATYAERLAVHIYANAKRGSAATSYLLFVTQATGFAGARVISADVLRLLPSVLAQSCSFGMTIHRRM